MRQSYVGSLDEKLDHEFFGTTPIAQPYPEMEAIRQRQLTQQEPLIFHPTVNHTNYFEENKDYLVNLIEKDKRK